MNKDFPGSTLSETWPAYDSRDKKSEQKLFTRSRLDLHARINQKSVKLH